MARVVPMPKTPLRGNAAVAVKRGLWRAGYIKGPALRFTPVFGPFAKVALKRYQRDNNLANVGTYTVPTHKHLARHFDDFAVWLLTKKPKPKPTLRDLVVANATLTYNERHRIWYTQGSRRMEGITRRIRPPNVPSYGDCSSLATWLYWAAGAPDPNDRGYDGYGYTGTLAQNGRAVSLSEARPGDLVFYGRYPYTHVAVYLGNGRVWSHGSSSGPVILPVDYRGDRAVIRSYLP